jgi:hypothetical protein
MNSFIRKYDSFVVEVDQKRKYVLQVTRALYQTMPVYKDENPVAEVKSQIVPKEMTKHEMEETDDFKYFMANIGKPVELL